MKILAVLLLFLVPATAFAQVQPLSGTVMNLQMELAKINAELADMKKAQSDQDGKIKEMRSHAQQQDEQMRALVPQMSVPASK